MPLINKVCGKEQCLNAFFESRLTSCTVLFFMRFLHILI